MNTVSAAVLEVAIMGIFVIIAQPQLRDALFEILHAGEPVPAGARANVAQVDRPSGSESPAAALERTLQAVIDSPVGQAVENSLTHWNENQRNENQWNKTQSNENRRPETSQPLPSTAPSSAGSNLRDQFVSTHSAGYAPFDQFESLRVNVPATNQYSGQQVSAQSALGRQVAYPHVATPQGIAPQLAVPQYVPPQSYASTHYGPTQLAPNQWNVASAAQPSAPSINQNMNANVWVPAHVTETSFRQVYPPPYGTQSMWK
jgi:hypothetical protein